MRCRAGASSGALPMPMSIRASCLCRHRAGKCAVSRARCCRVNAARRITRNSRRRTALPARQSYRTLSSRGRPGARLRRFRQRARDPAINPVAAADGEVDLLRLASNGIAKAFAVTPRFSSLGADHCEGPCRHPARRWRCRTTAEHATASCPSRAAARARIHRFSFSKASEYVCGAVLFSAMERCSINPLGNTVPDFDSTEIS